MESARKRSNACRMEGVDGMTGIHGARLGQTMIALMGVVAVIASLPETPKLDPLRVGKIVGALVRGRADEAERASPLRRLEIITVAQQVDAEPSPPADTPPQACGIRGRMPCGKNIDRRP